MPYKSKAQQAYFHAQAAEGKMDKKMVKEMDKASKGMKLPAKAKAKPAAKKVIKSTAQLRDIAKKKK